MEQAGLPSSHDELQHIQLHNTVGGFVLLRLPGRAMDGQLSLSTVQHEVLWNAFDGAVSELLSFEVVASASFDIAQQRTCIAIRSDSASSRAGRAAANAISRAVATQLLKLPCLESGSLQNQPAAGELMRSWAGRFGAISGMDNAVPDLALNLPSPLCLLMARGWSEVAVLPRTKALYGTAPGLQNLIFGDAPPSNQLCRGIGRLVKEEPLQQNPAVLDAVATQLRKWAPIIIQHEGEQGKQLLETHLQLLQQQSDCMRGRGPNTSPAKGNRFKARHSMLTLLKAVCLAWDTKNDANLRGVIDRALDLCLPPELGDRFKEVREVYEAAVIGVLGLDVVSECYSWLRSHPLRMVASCLLGCWPMQPDASLGVVPHPKFGMWHG